MIKFLAGFLLGIIITVWAFHLVSLFEYDCIEKEVRAMVTDTYHREVITNVIDEPPKRNN